MGKSQIKDQRILDVQQKINKGQFKVLSLDVFDTTVWRKVPKPVDLFLSLAEELKLKGYIWPETQSAGFAQLRIHAENEARQKKMASDKTMEVNLEEIYRSFPKGYLQDGVKTSDLIEAEIRCENQSIEYDKNILRLIKFANKKGLKVALVSDTYLTEFMLKEVIGFKDLLDQVNIDYVFTSTDYGTSKADKLFDHVLEMIPELDGKPEWCFHMGDNLHADVETPSKMGIETFHWEIETPGFDSILELETSPYHYKKSSLLDTQDGDFGLTAMRHRAVHHVDLPVDENAVFYRYGSAFMGPVLVPFAEWVWQSSKALGAETVLCLMREGRLFKSMLEAITEKSSCKFEELFVSRYALLRATILTGHPDELVEFLQRPTAISVETALEQLGVESINNQDLPFSINMLLDNGNALREFIKYIHATPSIKDDILQASAKQRENFIKHLKQKVDLSKISTLYLMDLGYGGTIQRKIEKILSYEYPHIKTHGYYLVTNSGTRKVMEMGGKVQGYLTDFGQPLSISHIVSRSPEVLEQCTMPDIGSTIGYDGKGNPILDDIYVPKEQLSQIHCVQKGILAFADYWKDTGISSIIDVKNEKFRGLVANILIRSITKPTYPEIDTFGNWQHDENFGAKKSRRLIDVQSVYEDLRFMNAHQIASIHSSKLYWPFAVARQKSEALGDAIEQIYLRNVDPKAFSAHEEDRKIIIFFDMGNGFSEEEAVIDSYNRSTNGSVRTRLHVSVKDKDIQSVAICIAGKNQLLRFDRLNIEICQNGESESLNYTNILGSELGMVGLENIFDRVFLSTNEMPFVVWQPEMPYKNFKGEIKFDFYFASLSAKRELV